MSLCRNPQQHTPRLSLDVSREIAGIYEQLFFPRKRPFSARQGALMESAVCQWQTLFTPSVTLTRAIPS